MYGRRIREVRETAGLSQGEFASELGIPQTTLSSYERENSQPRFEILKKICSLYNVDAGWLLGFTDYHDLLDQTYDDFADLLSHGFTVDEAYRMTHHKLIRYGDMIMRLPYKMRDKVTLYCEELTKQLKEEERSETKAE